MHEPSKLSVHIRLVEYLFKNRKLDTNFSIARVLIIKVNEFPNVTIDEIAYLAHTTPGSVTKFCKKLGYKSFKELRTDRLNYRYANLFRDMFSIAESKGIDSALNFFIIENQKKILEIFETFEFAQMDRIAKKLAKTKRGAVFTGLHGFAATNLFFELSKYFGIGLYEINRDSDQLIIENILKKEDIIFIISLTGKWINEKIKESIITEEHSQKIVLLTYQSKDKYSDFCFEVVSFKDFYEFYNTNYFSSSTLEAFFIFLSIYLAKEKSN